MSFYLQKHKNNIAYTKDIIEELQKRTGKKKEILEDVFNINLKYVHEVINNTDSIIIHFPKLGKLRLNYYFLLCYYKCVAKADLKRKLRLKIARLKDIIHKSATLRNFNKPNIFIIYRHITKDYQRNIMKNLYKCWSIAEENHNKTHAKYFKKS
jgi:hypothetical protein